MPFWSGNNILFLVEPSPPFSFLWPLIRMVAGKGDGNIWYYEYKSDSLYTLDEHKSSEPQRGMYFVPRRASNASECEIARTYKLTSNAIEPIAFIVPKQVNLPLSFPIPCRETDKCASPPPCSLTRSSLTFSHPHPPSSPALPQASSSSGKRHASVRPPRNGCSLHRRARVGALSDICCGASTNTLCDSTRAAVHANSVSLAR